MTFTMLVFPIFSSSVIYGTFSTDLWMHAYKNIESIPIETMKEAQVISLKFRIYKPFEETDMEESVDSRCDVSSLDDGFSRMQFESSSSEEHATDDDMGSEVWDEIKPESNTTFSEDYGMMV